MSITVKQFKYLQGVSKKTEFGGLLVVPVVCHLQKSEFDTFNIVRWAQIFFLFILHGPKKIVKNFRTKIQSATWSKYTLKNTKKSKKSKILRFRLQSKCKIGILIRVVNNDWNFDYELIIN